MRRFSSFGKYCTCASMSWTAVPGMTFSMQKFSGLLGVGVDVRLGHAPEQVVASPRMSSYAPTRKKPR